VARAEPALWLSAAVLAPAVTNATKSSTQTETVRTLLPAPLSRRPPADASAPAATAAPFPPPLPAGSAATAAAPAAAAATAAAAAADGADVAAGAGLVRPSSQWRRLQR